MKKDVLSFIFENNGSLTNKWEKFVKQHNRNITYQWKSFELNWLSFLKLEPWDTFLTNITVAALFVKIFGWEM